MSFLFYYTLVKMGKIECFTNVSTHSFVIPDKICQQIRNFAAQKLFSFPSYQQLKLRDIWQSLGQHPLVCKKFCNNLSITLTWIFLNIGIICLNMLSWLFSGILKDLKDYIRFYKNLFFSAIFFVFFGGVGGWGWGSHGRKSLVFIQFLQKDSQNFAKNYVSDLEISGFCEIA